MASIIILTVCCIVVGIYTYRKLSDYKSLRKIERETDNEVSEHDRLQYLEDKRYEREFAYRAAKDSSIFYTICIIPYLLYLVVESKLIALRRKYVV